MTLAYTRNNEHPPERSPRRPSLPERPVLATGKPARLYIGIATKRFSGSFKQTMFFLEDVNRAPGKYDHRTERDARLNYHHRLRPRRQHGHVSWRKSGAGVERQKQVVNEPRLPVLISQLHLWKEEGPRIVALPPIARVRASAVKTPVPRRKHQNIARLDSKRSHE